GGDVDGWRNFLRLLGRTNESLRAEGGIARVWTTMAGRHVELREIDYSEVLRERSAGDSASWDRIIAHCLQGSGAGLDETDIGELVALVQDSDRFGDFLAAVESQADGRSVSIKAAAVLKLTRTIVDRVGKADPTAADSTLGSIANAVGRLSPETLIGLVAQGAHEAEDAMMVGAVVG